MGLLHGGHKQGAPSTGSAHSSVRLVTVTSPICSPKQGEVTGQSWGPLRDSSHKQREAGLGALWCSLGQNGLMCHWVGLETSKVPSNLHSSVIDHFRPHVCVLVKEYWKVEVFDPYTG